jgi:N-carbamoyl-L-amino-acid hydrolase
MTALHVNGDRLWAALMEIGRIGETPAGGCRRLALSAEDGQARVLFCKWAK